jgi:hypothetical protein
MKEDIETRTENISNFSHSAGALVSRAASLGLALTTTNHYCDEHLSFCHKQIPVTATSSAFRARDRPDPYEDQHTNSISSCDLTEPAVSSTRRSGPSLLPASTITRQVLLTSSGCRHSTSRPLDPPLSSLHIALTGSHSRSSEPSDTLISCQ